MLVELSQFAPGEQVVIHVPGALNDDPLLSDRMTDLATMASLSSPLSGPPIQPLSQPNPYASQGGTPSQPPAFQPLPPSGGGGLTAQPAPMGSPLIGEALSGMPPNMAPPSGAPQVAAPGMFPTQPPPAVGLPGLFGSGESSASSTDLSAIMTHGEDKEKEEEEEENSQQEKGVKTIEGKVSRVDLKKNLIYVTQMIPPDLFYVHVWPNTQIRNMRTGKMMKLDELRTFDSLQVTGKKGGGHYFDATVILVNQGQ